MQVPQVFSLNDLNRVKRLNVLNELNRPVPVSTITAFLRTRVTAVFPPRSGHFSNPRRTRITITSFRTRSRQFSPSRSVATHAYLVHDHDHCTMARVVALPRSRPLIGFCCLNALRYFCSPIIIGPRALAFLLSTRLCSATYGDQNRNSFFSSNWKIDPIGSRSQSNAGR